MNKVAIPSKLKHTNTEIQSFKHRKNITFKINVESFEAKEGSDQSFKTSSLSQCLNSLQKEPSHRSTTDLQVIQSYLETTQLARKFKSDNIPDESLHKILLMCSTAMKYLCYPNEKILFRIGDEGTHFFIILKGRVAILKPVQYEEMLSGFEYFKHIISLFESDEVFMLKKTFELNQMHIRVEYSDLNIMKKIVLSNLLNDFYMDAEAKPSDLIPLIQSCNIDLTHEQLDIDMENLEDINYYLSIKKLLNTYIGDIPHKILEQYRGMKYKTLKNKYTLFKYQSFLELESGAFFGDLALDKKTTRNATIMTCEETHFCYLNINSYRDFLLAEKQRLTLNEVAFLVNNFFFKAISFSIFERKYLNYFIYQENYKGDELCTEGARVEYIYFIKEGQVELIVKKSVFEIHSLIKYLNELGPRNQLRDDGTLLTCRNNFEQLKNHLKKRKEQSLYITNGKECLGQESVYYGLNYLYTAKVITKKCKVYKIDVKSLIKLFQIEIMSYDWFAFNCKNKIKAIKERLNNIEESQICLVDYNIHMDTLNNTDNEIFSAMKKEKMIAASASATNKTKRILKCIITQIKPINAFNSAMIPNLTLPSMNNETKETLSSTERRPHVIRKKPYESLTTREDITSTPYSKMQRNANPNSNHYHLISNHTNDNSHCSLVTETRLLSKIQRELENDPMITNNNFIAIANKKKRLKIKETMTTEGNKNNIAQSHRVSIPKIRQKRNSNNFFLTENRHHTIEAKSNNTLINEHTLTQVKSDLIAIADNREITITPTTKMFSGRYFNEKKQTYKKYKIKRSNDNKDEDQ